MNFFMPYDVLPALTSEKPYDPRVLDIASKQLETFKSVYMGAVAGGPGELFFKDAIFARPF
jgi:hypothetical protein